MAAYDNAVIQGFLTAADTAPNAAVKGKAYEDLACYLFENVPGITITARNVKNAFHTEEIDVACWNEQEPAGLKSFNACFLVECKGWSVAVGSMEVQWFLHKIEKRGLDFGVMIAANGITGDPQLMTDAHSEVASYLTKKIRMVVVTRAEIITLTSGEQFAKLIIEKICRLHATGTQCY